MSAAPTRFSPQGRALVTSGANELVLSAASVWEIGIKHAMGKLPLPEAPSDLVPRLMREAGIVPLAILHRHALHLATLPRHHRDPFDRILVAQAQLEGMPLLTADPVFRRYKVEVIRA